MSSKQSSKPIGNISDLANTFEPWPLGTDAMVRILAWPDYGNPEQIQKVLQASRRLFGHDDACLMLRYDASVDVPVDDVIKNVNTQIEKRSDEGELNILIVDDEIPKDQWYRVGLTAFCSIGFKDDIQSVRFDFIDMQRSEKLFV